jgi:hypothetical protein
VITIGVGQLLKLVPDEVLEKIGQDLGVDHAYQKLTGLVMYKLLIYSLSKATRISLRTMEFIYNAAPFQKMLKSPHTTLRHSSLADRLSKINPDYFAKIFEYLIQTYSKQFNKKDTQNIFRFDSTLIGLTAKLFTIGMNCNINKNRKNNKKYLKVTIGQRGIIPAFVSFHVNQAESSEESALRKAVQEASIKEGDCVVFDRGISSGKAYVDFDENSITFITRVSVKRKVNILETMENADEISARKTETIAIISDQKVQLFDHRKDSFLSTSFRLIKTKSLKTNEELCFLTNDFETDAKDITELYRRRWDIEVFFRFIKQELNFKHFLARNLNGLKSYLYMVLIFSILFLIFKTENNRPGYKIVKMEFLQGIENEIIAEIVYFCGGNPQIFRDKYGIT